MMTNAITRTYHACIVYALERLASAR
jgi:hypothetical protein